jgi:anaerobic selenocysteine-containing dehydrogenase
VDLIASIARQVFGDASAVDWQALQRHCHVRALIAKMIPGLEQIGAIDQTRQEFHIQGRVLHQARFATPTGKARFTVQPLPSLPGGENELRLMTVRSEGQFNTVVYEEEDIYRGQDRRDVILMNRSDIDRLGLRVDQAVTVRSSVGQMTGILVRGYDIRAGNALMYYPEANVLVPPTTDPLSKTPAFKCVLITLEPVPSGSVATQARVRAGRVPLTLSPS